MVIKVTVGRRVSKAYTEACKMYQAKETELQEIESSMSEKQLEFLETDAASRGSEQYGAKLGKGTFNSITSPPRNAFNNELLGPSKAKVLIELKNMEDEELIQERTGIHNADHTSAHSGALFLSNALELEDLQ